MWRWSVAPSLRAECPWPHFSWRSCRLPLLEWNLWEAGLDRLANHHLEWNLIWCKPIFYRSLLCCWEKWMKNHKMNYAVTPSSSSTRSYKKPSMQFPTGNAGHFCCKRSTACLGGDCCIFFPTIWRCCFVSRAVAVADERELLGLIIILAFLCGSIKKYKEGIGSRHSINVRFYLKWSKETSSNQSKSPYTESSCRWNRKSANYK